MRALLLLPVLAGCSTMTLRAGATVVGGTPAFHATLEVGTSFGSKRLYELTHENGIQADGNGVAYVNGVNANFVTLDGEGRPVARIGPRLRATPTGRGDASIGARAAIYTGLGRDPRTTSGGVGVELGGGMQIDDREPVIEASIIATGKWSVF